MKNMSIAVNFAKDSLDIGCVGLTDVPAETSETGHYLLDVAGTFDMVWRVELMRFSS